MDLGAVNGSEELQVLAIVTGRLDSAGLPYMLTGSMALNYYAVPRMTRDIDLVVELSAPAADGLVELFREDFYVDPDAVRAAIADRGSFNLIHSRLLVKVDILVRKDTEYRRVEFERRRRVSFEEYSFDVVAPEDLIVSELDWARDTRSVSDTPRDVEARYHAMLLARSGEERLRMAGSMYATARALAVASIVEADPTASDAGVRQALFLRFYGHEFDDQTRARILARIAEDAER
jgi:hypothetical protein